VTDVRAEAFAAGYAQHGPLPMPPAARAAYRAADELALPTQALLEVGTVEGRRQALHKRRLKAQTDHSTAALAVTAAWRSSVDATALTRLLLPTVAAGRDAVRQAALDELDRQARMADGLGAAWQQVNADAYTAATAEGIAQASNSPDEGGPAKPADVARDLPAAVAGIATADAWRTADSWTAQQLGGLAGDVARAIGPGPDIPAATAAARDASRALDEVVQAARDALDAATGIGFYAEEQSAQATGLGFLLYLDQPGTAILVDFVTMGDPRVEALCQAYSAAGPYLPGDVPDIPVHGLCRCWYERHIVAAALAA
jgi:hypothetical protein